VADAEVVVNQDVPYAGNLPPRHRSARQTISVRREASVGIVIIAGTYRSCTWNGSAFYQQES
jgi:hypothetical protein